MSHDLGLLTSVTASVSWMASFIHSFIHSFIDWSLLSLSSCGQVTMSASMWCVGVQLFCNTDSRLLYSAVLAAEHRVLYSWTLYSALLRRTSVLTVGLPSLDISISSLRGQPSGHQGTEENHSMTPSSSRLHVGCGFECSFTTVFNCTWPKG